MSNRFKNKMSKEKAKEIVGSNTIKENIIEIETKETNIPPLSAPTDAPLALSRYHAVISASNPVLIAYFL